MVKLNSPAFPRDKDKNAGRDYHPRPQVFGRRFVPGEGSMGEGINWMWNWMKKIPNYHDALRVNSYNNHK